MGLKLFTTSLLLLLHFSTYVGAIDSFGSEFYVPIWVKSPSRSDSSCHPTGASLHFLYLSTNQPNQLNASITFDITNGTSKYMRQHAVTVAAEEMAIFNVVDAFVSGLEEILRPEYSIDNSPYTWWIEQPIHIVAPNETSVSVFVMSTLSNVTSIFPAFPVPVFQYNYYLWVIMTPDMSQLLREGTPSVHNEILVIKPLAGNTYMTIKPNTNSVLSCRLTFDYSGPDKYCSTHYSNIYPNSHYTPPLDDSREAIILMSTGESDLSSSSVGPSFAGANIYSDKPALVYLERTVNTSCSSGARTTSRTSINVQQQLDNSTNAYKFILLSPDASEPPYYTRYQWLIVWHNHHARDIEYHIWNSTSSMHTVKVDPNVLDNRNPHFVAFDKTMAAMVTIDTGGRVATGYYDPSQGRYSEHSQYLTVPGVEQYRNRYILPDPRYQLRNISNVSEHSYVIKIIVPAEYFDMGDVVLNGGIISKSNFTAFKMENGDPAFYVTKVSLPNVSQRHLVSHSNTSAYIGVTVSGFSGNDDFSARNVYTFTGGFQDNSASAVVLQPSQQHTARTVGIIAGAGVGSAVALLVAITVAMCVVKRLWKKLKHRRQRYQHLPGLLRRREPDGINCQYDVFLSFADEDLPFVETYIYHQLEERGFQVCWHHRDFPPGYSIIENIKNSIDRSRRVILVLSEHFHRSEYCLFELRYSCEKMLASHTQFVIPLVLHQESLPRELDHMTYWKLNPQEPDLSDIESFIRTLGPPIQPSHDRAALA